MDVFHQLSGLRNPILLGAAKCHYADHRVLGDTSNNPGICDVPRVSASQLTQKALLCDPDQQNKKKEQQINTQT